MKNKVYFTDGEGPIVSKDLAFDLTKAFSGRKFFLALSLYDDYLAEAGTAGYQAGDTLALIVPHLLIHGITNQDILEESKTAKLVPGVKTYLSDLQKDGWEVRIISTAYRPLWNLIGQQLGIPKADIACTELDLDLLRARFGTKDFFSVVKEAERDICGQPSDRRRFSQLYFHELPRLGYRPLDVVRVMGGKRKIEAAKQFAKELAVSLSEIVYVGDSITDSALFKYLNKEHGLSIAVNGNKYALRDAQVAVATNNMTSLRPLLDAWVHTKKGTTYSLLKDLPLKEFARILSLHKKSRLQVRGEAAKLG